MWLGRKKSLFVRHSIQMCLRVYVHNECSNTPHAGPTKERWGKNPHTKHPICALLPKHTSKIISALPLVLQLQHLTNHGVVKRFPAVHFNTTDDVLWIFQSPEAEVQTATWLHPLHWDQKQAMSHLSHLPSKMSSLAKLWPLLNSWCSSTVTVMQKNPATVLPLMSTCPMPAAALPLLPWLHLPFHVAQSASNAITPPSSQCSYVWFFVPRREKSSKPI